MPIIKLELSASVGFVHKESITMHGHTILKFDVSFFVIFSILHVAAEGVSGPD
jgi:hypothetical protein